ncbi:MAG: hypothetical protein RI935_582 [Candidatus Parcubacteria bacterium]|jgi:type II secretory pathway pseudopilin PulG
MQVIIHNTTQSAPKNSSLRGLSLVEILIVLGLFSGVSTLALGALFNTQALNNRLLQNQSILDNVNLSILSLTRDIRYGSEFHCTTNDTIATTTRNGCPLSGSPGDVLLFRSSEAVDTDDRVVYYVKNKILYKKEIPKTGLPLEYQMTSEDIMIEQFLMYVDGAYASVPTRSKDSVSIDYAQPKITFIMSGTAKPSRPTDTPLKFSLQTVISPRLIDTN